MSSNIFISFRLKSKKRYRSRQYYESKILRNTEVIWFSIAQRSLKTIINIVVLFISFFLHLLSRNWVNILFKNGLESSLRNRNSGHFCFKIGWNNKSEGNSNVDCGANNRSICALKLPKEMFLMGQRNL